MGKNEKSKIVYESRRDCVDEFSYKSTKKKFENCLYIGKIFNVC